MGASPAVAVAGGPAAAPEGRVAAHLARNAAVIAPVVVIFAGLVRGGDGAVSAALAAAIVAANFLVSARLIAWAAPRGPGVAQGAVLGGFVVRLAVLAGIVVALEQLSFVDVPVLVVTIAVSHLALLVWETRYVSLTLAAPGLKPGVGRQPTDKE